MSRLIDRLTLLLATGLGVGFIPGSPGTFGSLWGLLIAWGLAASGIALPLHSLTLVGLLLVGVPICQRAAQLLGKSDPGSVVYDEFASLPIAFVAVGFSTSTAIAGFLLFRLFDIWKPWPIRRLEHLPGGWGVMADDIGAAILTALALWPISRVWL